ncbi:hypothetical protein [Paenibacillus sp.]|uniref:hypothetical protein n=1 Tax=Paenibacillus sp. TaxID=58172 RepID=UPI002D3A7321|nr:hypothetical protein [Paenibacillus sp.]HZG56195.1 hypothetical protein [Paenibacillus sp.]
MTFDELLLDLQGQRSAPKHPEQAEVERLFNDAFMRQHSEFDSFKAFLEDGNFQVKTLSDVREIPDELFDRHVARKTKFPNWQAMLDAANAASAKDEA